MKPSLFATGCIAALVVLAGCSSQDSKAPQDTATTSGGSVASSAPEGVPHTPPAEAAPDADHVKFGASDVGPITAVSCQTDAGLTTISIEANPSTTVVLTDEDAPAVQSVSIGEAGSEGASLVFLEGVSATPQAARDGKKYTVTGSGLGTDSANPATPTEMPFEIVVSCP